MIYQVIEGTMFLNLNLSRAIDIYSVDNSGTLLSFKTNTISNKFYRLKALFVDVIR